MPSFINFRGYTDADPLDKPRPLSGFFILAFVNTILSIILIYLITNNRIVYFHGPAKSGFFSTPLSTEIIEVIVNGFIFSALIFMLRKCTSLVPFLIVLLPYYLLDLYIESHFRLSGHSDRALWMYYPDSFVSNIHPAPLRFFASLSADAIIFGLLGLFLARLVASWIYSKKPYPPIPTKEQYNNLFRARWCEEDPPKPTRGVAFWVLRLLGIGYFIYLMFLVIGLLGSKPWPAGMAHLIDVTYSNPVLAINTYFKITLMVVLAFTAAYNRTLRYYCCAGLLAGHLISTAYSLGFHFFQPRGTSETDFLLLSGIVDGTMVVIFFIIMLAYRKDAKIFDPEKDSPIDWSFAMSVQQWLYRILALLFMGVVVLILLTRLLGEGKEGLSAIFGYPDPLISNTVTFYGALSVLFFLQVRREQLRAYLFNPVVMPLLAGSVLSLIWIIVADMHGGALIKTRHCDESGCLYTRADWYFVLEGLIGILICFALIGLRRLFYSADYGLNSINPSTAICFVAITETFFDGDNKQHAQMLRSVDSFIGGIRGRKRGLLNLPFAIFENGLNFFYNLHPPFSSMEKEQRLHYLRKYFLRNDWERRRAFIPPLADIAFQIGIALNTFVSFAQFNHVNTRSRLGYVPVDARDRTQGDCASTAPPLQGPARLPKDHLDQNNFKPTSNCDSGPMLAPRLTTFVSEPEIPDEADYIVIGSGAGGATAAYRLACEVADPSRILIIESGNRYQPLQDFNDDEMNMFHKLYKEGGLQQTKQFTMTVAQGQCVGGTTVINNAVCFKMPSEVREDWRNNFGLELAGLDEAYRQVEKELNISPLGDKGVNQKVRSIFDLAVSKYNQSVAAGEQLDLEDPVMVNHRNNTGDGNWNIGNKRMQKRSMLETYIPWSEARGVKLISATSVAGYSCNGRKADYVIVRASNGKITRIKVNKAIIVAAGAISSSQLLMRSGANKNTGCRLSCNFAFPIALDFDEELRAFDGDQITIAALDPKSRAAFETYFNPPASFSITSVPFFFKRRDALASRYKYLTNFGALIGSEPNGKVLPKSSVLAGQSFEWNLGATDIDRIKFALTGLAKLGKHAGARRAVLPTKPGIELDLRSGNSVEDFKNALADYPLRITDLYIGTAHPQGGNAMAASSSEYGSARVVNEDFRVEGLDNVFVADASLFPTSITVNPQWTIMALSTLAAKSALTIT